MPSIQSFTMTVEEVNESGTFSEGDTVRGKVTLVLLKETTVDSFFVKLKGDADVRWSSGSGSDNSDRTYSAHRRYVKLWHTFIGRESSDNVIRQGTHVYEFCLTIPTGSLPSTYKGSHGRIIYMMKTKLCRSGKRTVTVERELKFVSKANPNPESLMSRQVGSTNKLVGFFSRGNVHMNVIVDGQRYAPGNNVAVVATINNASSRDMVPKISLIQNVVYHAQGTKKRQTNVIRKKAGKLVRPNKEKTANFAIEIPSGAAPTIKNCEIILLEYKLKVYLDISFASDPEVIFPVTICHPELISNLHSGSPGGPFQPSAPLTDTNFLSQTDDLPPSYSLLFPNSTIDDSNANQQIRLSAML